MPRTSRSSRPGASAFRTISAVRPNRVDAPIAVTVPVASPRVTVVPA